VLFIPKVFIPQQVKKRNGRNVSLRFICKMAVSIEKVAFEEDNKKQPVIERVQALLHSLIFCVQRYMHLQCIRLYAYIRVCCHSNETCASIANPPNSAQLGGTPYHSPSYIRICAVVWECGKGQTGTQMSVANIHFASAIPHMKSKYSAVMIN